ncbi:hypothetical protein IF2G_06664 [Cordyceps javanica]|nr:hypothetical protein IF2G_06664 [Cordyceps javanica]
MRDSLFFGVLCSGCQGEDWGGGQLPVACHRSRTASKARAAPRTLPTCPAAKQSGNCLFSGSTRPHHTHGPNFLITKATQYVGGIQFTSNKPMYTEYQRELSHLWQSPRHVGNKRRDANQGLPASCKRTSPFLYRLHWASASDTLSSGGLMVRNPHWRWLGHLDWPGASANRSSAHTSAMCAQWLESGRARHAVHLYAVGTFVVAIPRSW